MWPFTVAAVDAFLWIRTSSCQRVTNTENGVADFPIVRDFNAADLVYTGVRVQTFTVAGELMHERIHHLPFDFPRLLEGNFIFTVATAFRRSLWDEVGHYDQRFPVYEDWEFLIRVTHGREVRALTCCSAISRAFTGASIRPMRRMNARDAVLRCNGNTEACATNARTISKTRACSRNGGGKIILLSYAHDSQSTVSRCHHAPDDFWSSGT